MTSWNASDCSIRCAEEAAQAAGLGRFLHGCARRGCSVGSRLKRCTRFLLDGAGLVTVTPVRRVL